MGSNLGPTCSYTSQSWLFGAISSSSIVSSSFSFPANRGNKRSPGLRCWIYSIEVEQPRMSPSRSSSAVYPPGVGGESQRDLCLCRARSSVGVALASRDGEVVCEDTLGARLMLSSRARSATQLV